MTSKFSRTALIVAIALGVSGLVAVPAEAANGVSTANYFVKSPAVSGATNITPESATLTGDVDTGGSQGTSFTVPTNTTLTWNSNFADLAAGAAGIVDGLPVSGGNDSITATITDAAGGLGNGLTSGTAGPVNNAGADNYSEVDFWYDPAKDYVANSDAPGQDTITSGEVDVQTMPGLGTHVSVTVGGFPAASAQDSGQSPLAPNTTYYYGLTQNPGVTDAAQDVNIAQWVDAALPNGTSPTSTSIDADPTYKCYPDSVIADDPTLASYTTATQITPQTFANGVAMADASGFTGAQPGIQGPCTYYYGNTSGAQVYGSTVGTFKTLALGKVTFGGTATVARGLAADTITDSSVEAASGSVRLTAKVKGKAVTFATGTFHVGAGASDPVSFKLSKKGLKILEASKSGKQSTKVVFTSNTDQPNKTKTITLQLS